MPTTLYKQNIIDHYKCPKNSGKIKNPTHSSSETNASCGDEIIIYLIVENDRIVDFKFEARGCAISIATISILSDKILNSSIQEVLMMSDESVLELINMGNHSGRRKCALLGLVAVKKAL